MEKVTGQQVDYKTIGRKLSSGENLDDSERDSIFDIAREYARGLVVEKSGYGFSEKDQEVKDYLVLVTINRILDLHQEAVKNEIPESDSITRFGELKNILCMSLTINPDTITDTLLESVLNDELDIHLFPSGKVKEEIKYIRETGGKIVPPNPSTEARTHIEYKLD